jgi:hypothetical protein
MGACLQRDENTSGHLLMFEMRVPEQKREIRVGRLLGPAG